MQLFLRSQDSFISCYLALSCYRDVCLRVFNICSDYPSDMQIPTIPVVPFQVGLLKFRWITCFKLCDRLLVFCLEVVVICSVGGCSHKYSETLFKMFLEKYNTPVLLSREISFSVSNFEMNYWSTIENNCQMSLFHQNSSNCDMNFNSSLYGVKQISFI